MSDKISRLLFAVALLFCACFAHAQNVRQDGVVQSRSGQPAPGARIAVCSQPATTTSTPCLPLAPLCTSLTDIVCSSQNPVIADGLGNYHFYVPTVSLPVTIQFYGSTVTTSSLPDQTFGGGGGGGSGTVSPGAAGNPVAYYPGVASVVAPQSNLNFSGTQSNFPNGPVCTGASCPSACGSATSCQAVNLSTGVVTPTAGQATFRFLADGMHCSVNGAAELICGGGGGGGTPPGAPLNSFQYNSASAFGGAIGFNYSAGAGINPGIVNGDDINRVVTVTPDFNFTACPSGCNSTISPTTIAAGSNTITLTPVPLGVNGTNNPHFLQLSGSGSPTEYVLLSGGTAVSGAASGTIIFTAAFAHASNPPTIASATTGIQEAAWFAQAQAAPGQKIYLLPGTTYTCNAPLFILGNDAQFDGQWGIILDASFSSCAVMGPQVNGVWATDSQADSIEVAHIDFRPKQVNWDIAPTAPPTITGLSTTATLNIATCPIAAFPGQLLWLAGTNAGVPTSYYGYGEYVVTTGGTCTPGNAGTIIIAQATPNATNLSSHGSGYTISNGVGAYIEDSVGIGGHIHDVRVATGSGGGTAGNGIQIDNDQSFGIDNFTMQGSITRGDADFQGAGIFSPGAYASNAGIGYIGPNVNISAPLSCIKWFSGNDFDWTSGICQNYSAGGIIVGNKRGGFGSFTVGENVHWETGGNAPPWGNGNVVGNPPIMVVGAANHPVLNYGDNLEPPFAGGNAAPWPTFLAVGGATHSQFYYLVAHNNALSGCTSGGDCFSPPIFIGIAGDDDPSINNVSVTWFGWGDNLSVPTAYDLLAVSSVTPAIPQVPVGTGLYAVATNVSPSSICSIHNICTITDNVAPGSRSSYSPVYLTSSNKRYYPDSFLMPGVVAMAGDGNANNTGPPSFYVGTPTCINAMEFLGGRYVGDFISHSGGTDNDVTTSCPLELAPVATKGPALFCINSAGTCGSSSSGSVSIAAAATTVTVTSTAVTPWSRFKINEDSTKGALLGVTCNTTTGRTYSVTTATPGVSIVITASAAPVTNPACLDIEIDNAR